MSAIRKTASAALVAFSVCAPAAYSQTGVHPGFTFTSLRPTGFNPMVSGLDFMPNGDLVVSTWDAFGKTSGSVFIVANARTGTAANITFKKFAGSLNEPLGVKVLDGVVHVVTRDQILVLPDSNSDGTAETPRKLAGDWGTLNSDPRTLEFAFGLPYKAGKFYVGLATAWPHTLAQDARRGCILEVDAVTGAHTTFACGFRTPNGMVLGPADNLFITENQGNWVPASKLTHVGRNRFYGVKKTHPAGFPTGLTETPPSVWVPHGDVSISPTQPVWLRSGLYKGQMIAGDNNLGTLQRYFLEKIGAEYQGAVFKFSAGLEAGANRIISGPNGEIYVGGIGTSTWGGWDWNDKWYGLQRMAPNAQGGTGAFEFLAVRSKGATSFEVQFTEPAAAGAGTPGNWVVRQWGYVPAEAYGAGKQANENLTVGGAQLSADGLKATLTIPGLKARNVVHIRLNNVQSASGKNLWSSEAWYTLNAFGPGTDVEEPATSIASAREAMTGPRVEVMPGLPGQGALIAVASPGAFQAEIRDATGSLRQVLRGVGPLELRTDARLEPGVYALSVRGAQGSRTVALRLAR